MPQTPRKFRKLSKIINYKLTILILGSWMLVRVCPDSAGNYSCSTHTSNTAIVTINVVVENYNFR